MSKSFRLFPLILVLTVLLIALAIYAVYPRQVTWNQKLTIHIQTPDGPVVASSIGRVEFKGGHRFFYPIIVASSTKFTGEAVVAKLGDQYLFMLTDKAQDLLFYAWRSQQKNDSLMTKPPSI